MLNIPDEQLKLTIRPGRSQLGEIGIHLDIAQDLRTQAQLQAREFKSLKQFKPENSNVSTALRILQANLVNRLYRGVQQDLQKMNILEGPNHSQMAYEVFQDYPALVCDDDSFCRRSSLKIQRTLLNIGQLRQAYPVTAELSELEAVLQKVDQDADARVLRKTLLQLGRSVSFASYLKMKQQFVEEWVDTQKKQHCNADFNPLNDDELSGMMKALIQQKKQLVANHEVMRYKDQQFFRYFNSVSHDVLNTQSIQFWKTEENRESFLRFIMAIRSSFQETTPFFVFRFENSFTYLLCGFSDEDILSALEGNRDVVMPHAKIILRQSNQVYRELTVKDSGNQTLYFNCLKEAMKLFVLQLNHHLQIDLPPAFLRLFEI
ncbi:MAG: hypothetical protein HQM12_06920 [SAR324 cluster bacterium]|nr:hypothetical protein [SAR324 cluster bacterium]